MFKLKPLHPAAIQAALEKAVRYRLLNEPLEAESICRDVLEIDPPNQQALATLILALTDQFPNRLVETFAEARGMVSRMQDEYEQQYYQGIICERRAKCHIRQSHSGTGSVAYGWLRQAMEHYERAEAMAPEGNDEALLRWNTCVRILKRHPEVRPTEQTTRDAIELE